MHHSKTVQGSLNYYKFLVIILIADTTCVRQKLHIVKGQFLDMSLMRWHSLFVKEQLIWCVCILLTQLRPQAPTGQLRLVTPVNASTQSVGVTTIPRPGQTIQHRLVTVRTAFWNKWYQFASNLASYHGCYQWVSYYLVVFVVLNFNFSLS